MFNSPFSAPHQPPRNYPPHRSMVFEPETQSQQNAHLPPSGIRKEQIDYCKSILNKQRDNISYREVLERISERPWFLSASHSDRLEITKKLIAFRPAVLEEYNRIAGSESLMARFMARIPFLGKELPSERFLESLSTTNEIISELQSNGMLTVKTIAPDVVMVGRPDGFMQVGIHSLSISVSDWGKLVLAS
jgi:hypothetical protein